MARSVQLLLVDLESLNYPIMRYLSVFLLLLTFCKAEAGVENIRQRDITTSSFTVSFSGDVLGEGVIKYGLNEGYGSVIVNTAPAPAHTIVVDGLAPATVYYVRAGFVLAPGDTLYSEPEPMFTASLSSGSIKVYFNSEVDHDYALLEEAVSLGDLFPDTLIAYLDRAQHTIDFTSYNIDNQNGLIDALNAAHNRGVNVRFVGHHSMNQDNFTLIQVGDGNKVLSPTGFAPSGGFYGLMHNKFIAIDADSDNPFEPIVITGSTNFTNNQLKVDPNNLIIFQDQSLAKGFTIEFEEMFGETFGPEKSVKTPKEYNIGGVRVEAHFSPKSRVEDVLISKIAEFEHDMYFGMFSHTRVPISQAIAQRANEGYFVAGILNQINQSNEEFTILQGALNDRLFVDALPGSWHHKYALFDPNCENGDPMVYTGSANWSNNGNLRSDENVVVVHDLNIANQYYQEFMARFFGNGGTAVADECVIEVNIEEVEEGVSRSGAIELFPNPNNGNFNLTGSFLHQTTVVIYDNSGRAIYETQLQPGETHIAPPTLHVGHYLIRFVDAVSGEALIKRFLVQP